VEHFPSLLKKSFERASFLLDRDFKRGKDVQALVAMSKVPVYWETG